MNSYFKSCYTVPLSADFISSNDEDILSPIDKDEMDVLCPVDSVTGLRSQPLTRILDPSTSDSERNALLSTLQKLPSTSDNADDETKMMFVKLRSCQTASELASFRSSIQQWLDSHPEFTPPVDTPPVDTSSVDTPSVDTPPVDTPPNS